MYHYVFYFGEVLFDGVVYAFGDGVGFAQGFAAVGAYFYVYVYFVAEYAGAQEVYV